MEEMYEMFGNLRGFEAAVRALANVEETDDFAVIPGYQDGQHGFFLKMTRRFLAGRIEGVEYRGLCAYLMCDKAWAKSNLQFLERFLKEWGLAEEMPAAWTTLYEKLPGKGGFAQVFIPNEEIMEG
jgi:hypothetical protein